MTIYEMITTELKLPCAYGYHSTKQTPPYFCVMGSGQEQFQADNTYYTKKNNWQVEYYFTDKDTELEDAIENLFLNNGYKYNKSEDVYIESEDVFVIYYDL